MKKILLCLCFVFAVGLLFSACGKDDKKQNPAPNNDVTTNAPPELIPQGKEEEAAEEKVKIEASDDLQALAAEQGITFEISELVFGTEPHRIRGNETDSIVVENGKNYSFMFGLKIVGGDLDGMTIYQYIDVSGAEWTLAENAAVTKTDTGFKVKDDFYANDGNVTVTVNISNYKHLPSKQFTFVLKSEKVDGSPAAQTQVGDSSQITVNNITIKMELVLPHDTENTEWKIVGNEVWALPVAFGYNRGDTRKIYVKLTISGASNNDFNGDYYLDKNNGRVVAFEGIPPNVNFNQELNGYEGIVNTVIYPQDSAPVVGATMTDTYTTISIQGTTTTFNLMKDYKVRIVSSL